MAIDNVHTLGHTVDTSSAQVVDVGLFHIVLEHDFVDTGHGIVKFKFQCIAFRADSVVKRQVSAEALDVGTVVTMTKKIEQKSDEAVGTADA